jgi:hypothetical protein
VVTVTGSIPGVKDGGTVTVMEVVEFTVTALDASTADPNDTCESGVKCVPVITICPPPASGDDDGVIELIYGASGESVTANTMPVS